MYGEAVRDTCSVGGGSGLWRFGTKTCNSLPGELTVKVIESSCVLLVIMEATCRC